MNSGFWSLNLGNLLTIVGLSITVWLAHQSNIKHMTQQAERLQEIETKVELIFRWFENNVIGHKSHSKGAGE